MNSQLLHITKTMLDAAMGDYIKRDIIPCCSYSLQRGDTILLQSSLGWQDRQAQQALRDDGIFRIYSSTKLMSSVVAMQLIERGKLALEQPVAEFIPSYAELSVLRPEAQDINDCEPLQQAMTVRHLLSHSAGFSYGFVDPAGLVDQAYLGGGLNLLKPYPGNLDDFVRQLGQFPLVFQPGSDWRYSLATDVLGYILEAVSGQRLDTLYRQVLFEPLQMHDTGFALSQAQAQRLVTLYQAPDMYKPMTPGYHCLSYALHDPCATPTFLSAGGGLYSSRLDMQRFLACLAADAAPVLKPGSLATMLENQLAVGKALQFPLWQMPNTGFGLGFALKFQGTKLQHYYWGGLAGTHSWVRPDGLCGLAMTQLMPAFWHPFSQEFQQLAWRQFATAQPPHLARG